MIKKTALLLLVGALGGLPAARAVDPDINNSRGYGDSNPWILPLGGQRGAEVEVTLRGTRLDDAEEILFYKKGIEVLEISDRKSSTFKARLKISTDCELGEHPFRVRTKTGVTQLGTFNVGPFPTVEEKEPNNEFAKAQKLDGNATVQGRVDSEDIDYYLIDAKKGQRLGAEVEGVRLNLTLFDPYVAIRTQDGKLLAESDDTGFGVQDPATSVVAPEDGTYVVELRESAYGGGSRSYYRAHIGLFPRPLAVYPAGGKAGEKVQFTFLGDATGEFTREVTLPKETNDEFPIHAVRGDQVAPTAHLIRVSDFDNALEAEPNNDTKTATATGKAAPVALNGRLNEPGDTDFFKFSAKKGQSFHVHVRGREIHSPIDAVLYIYNEKGSRVTSNDDSRGTLDSYVRFNVPADGEYFLSVTDHQKRGGDPYVYRVEISPYVPTLTLSIPHVSRRNSQGRQAMVIPRGNKFATLMTIGRDGGLRGDMKFHASNLPQGVSLKADILPGNYTTVPVIFEAAPDAPLGATFADLTARLIQDGKEVEVPGSFQQTWDQVHSNPNSTVYKQMILDKMVVAVTEEAPFRIKLHQPKAPLAQYGDMKLQVEIEKDKGWDETVYVYLPFRPSGISGYSRIAVAKGKTTADYSINSRYNAQVRKSKIVVNGYASVKGGSLWMSSDFVDLDVVERFVLGKFETASVDQGEKIKVTCKLDQKVPFEGKATLTLYGTPPNITVSPVEITKDAKEAVFEIQTTEKTPPGAYKYLYTKINFPMNGEAVQHMVATSGRLIVNKPKPAVAGEGDKKKVALAK